MPVQANITGVLQATLKDTIKTGILNVNDSTDITFNKTLNMSAGGNYVFNSSTNIKGDENHSNDAMLQQNFNVFKTVATFPYLENFESFETGSPGVFKDGWLATSDSYYQWQVNSGPQFHIGTGPEVDNTLGTKDGKYLFVKADSTGGPAYLTSPCIDSMQLNRPYFSFWYHMAGTKSITCMWIFTMVQPGLQIYFN